MILHVTTRSAWKSQADKNHFSSEAFLKEGFNHCCDAGQLTGVLKRYFTGINDLLLLHIDESKLNVPFRYESSTNDEKFPHVYAPGSTGGNPTAKNEQPFSKLSRKTRGYMPNMIS